MQKGGAEPRRANKGGETGDDALNREQRIKTDSSVSCLGEVKNAGITDRSGVIREVTCPAGWRYCSAHGERCPAAGGTRFRHLQTERSHLGGDILTIVSGVILNMSTHDSHTACVSDTR